MSLSAQQQAVGNWVDTGNGSAIVRARAGTGKTFTLINLMHRMNGRVAYAVYNKKNSVEAVEKVSANGLTNVTVGTFHKFGFDALRMANHGLMIEGRGRGNAGFFKFDVIADELEIPSYMRAFVRSAMSKAKLRGFGVLCEFNSPSEWLNLVSHFDLDLEIAEDALKMFGDRDALIRDGLRLACKGLKMSIVMAQKGVEFQGKKSGPVIDFDDMIYMPLISNCRMPTYDWLLVDEAQDTNPVRRALAKRMLAVGGRSIWVGDDFQALYGFTGADSDSLDQISKEFSTVDFPLTVTYRCPKAVVTEAKKIVPDYVAHEDAPEGSYSIIDELEFNNIELVPGQDAVICRNTKPLVEVAFSLIKKGVPCHVEGREIGKGLIKLANRWQRIKSLVALTEKLEDFRDKQVTKLMAQGKEQQADSINDQVDTLQVIINGLPKGSTLADLHTKIESMFSDSEEGRKPTVTLMTIHRSKGLEFPRVFLWGRNVFMPSKFARQDWQLHSEKCAAYVGITRAMRDLVEVKVAAK